MTRNFEFVSIEGAQVTRTYDALFWLRLVSETCALTALVGLGGYVAGAGWLPKSPPQSTLVVLLLYGPSALGIMSLTTLQWNRQWHFVCALNFWASYTISGLAFALVWKWVIDLSPWPWPFIALGPAAAVLEVLSHRRESIGDRDW